MKKEGEPSGKTRMLKRFNRRVGKIINGFEVSVLVFCVAALAVLLIANVFFRTFFQSIYFAEEISKFLVILITFVGVSYGVRKARHIRMGAFLDLMPPKMEKCFIIFISLISAITMAIMAWYSYKYLLNAMNMAHKTPALRVPTWTFYLIVPVGFGLASIQYIRTIIKNLTESEPWQSPDQKSEYEDEQIGGGNAMMLFGINLASMLLIGFPFMVILLASLILYLVVYMPEMAPKLIIIMVQQVITGISPPALVCVPMFILSASLVTSGESAVKLIRMLKTFVGHLPGGLPITTNASCTLFGAVSGSTQATVAAIGGTMRPMLLEAGYPSSFTLGLIINSSDIAFLIPPSIGFIVYGVATSTSIGMLFLAGILPGFLIFLLFSLYCYAYSKAKKIPLQPKASWDERFAALKAGIPVMGFPVIVIGGIYTGYFSPTEAAAVSVLYALLLETIVFRSLTFNRIVDAFLQTGVITGVVFILVGAGQAFSWLIGFLQIPQQILPPLFGQDPSSLWVITIVVCVYFVACMFVDPIVAIFILSPIFQPYVVGAGVDPILLGTLVTLQAAIGSATPPFGCDIFTAQLIFRRPYLEVIGHALPFLLILIFVTVVLVMFPQIALFLPNMMQM